MDLKAVFVDAAGTLLKPREPVGLTYARFARERGIEREPWEVQARFRQALGRRRGVPQEGDGRAYWAGVVAESLETDDLEVFEALYRWYGQRRAWWVDLDALRVLGGQARAGVRLGIISNWDTRLRGLYTAFALDRMFSVLICSAEVGVQKPDPAIFQLACACAGCRPSEAVHVGDDPVADVAGAVAAGLVGLRYEEELGWATVGEQLRRLRSPAWFQPARGG